MFIIREFDNEGMLEGMYDLQRDGKYNDIAPEHWDDPTLQEFVFFDLYWFASTDVRLVEPANEDDYVDASDLKRLYKLYGKELVVRAQHVKGVANV